MALPQHSVEDQQPVQLDPKDLRYGSSRYPQAPASIEQWDGQREDAAQQHNKQPYWGTLRKSVVLAPAIPQPVGQHHDTNSPGQQPQASNKPAGYYQAPHARQGQRRMVAPRQQRPPEAPGVPPARAPRPPRAKRYKDEAVQTSFAESLPRKISVASKRYGLADPVVWESIRRSLSQQKRLSSLQPPDDPARDDHCTVPVILPTGTSREIGPPSGSLDTVRIPSDEGADLEKRARYLFLNGPEAHSAFAEDVDKIPSLAAAFELPPSLAGPSNGAANSPHKGSNPPQPPSRTSSQIRAFRYFTKELERYADITSAAGKVANFTPTISPIALSLHTVEELLPYRDQFLAAGLAVTSADQSPVKGKGARSEPEHAQLDGSGKTMSTSSPTSSTTMIHFGGRDSMDMALIDELPVRKSKEKKRKTQTRSILPWFRKKPAVMPEMTPPVRTGQPQDVLIARDEVALDQAQAPEPLRKSSMRDTEKHDESAAVVSPGSSREKRGHHRIRPPPPKQPPPPVPSKGTVKAPRGMEIRLRHRTIITRVPDSVDDIQPVSSRSKSPSHVRHRHSPATHPVVKKRLSTKLEEAEEILAEHSTTGREFPLKPMPDPGTRNTVRMRKQQPYRPPLEAVSRVEKPDVRVAPVEQKSSSRPQFGTEHSFSPTPPAMIRKSTELSPVLPVTWQYAVGTPSSFEQALDDVVRKLDEMEANPAISELEITLKPKTRRGIVPPEKPVVHEARPEDVLAKEADVALTEQKQPADGQPQIAKAMTTDNSSSSFANHRLQRAAAMRRQRIAAGDGAKSSKPPKDTVPHIQSDVAPPYPPPAGGPPGDEKPPPRKKTTKTIESLSVEDVTVDHYDRDINDRDVLKGLKLAASAACDENLDSWIRGKTGLRLRRFLADLKTFKNLDIGDQISDKRTANKLVKDKVCAKEMDNEPDPAEHIAKTADKSSVVDWKVFKDAVVEKVEAAQPEETKGKPRTSAGIRRYSPDEIDNKEAENKRTSASVKRPEPQPSDQEARTCRAEKRKAQADEEKEQEQRHKHLLRADA